MKRIDKTNWSRAEIFEFFSSISYPFYSVTFRVDVTNLHAYVRKSHRFIDGYHIGKFCQMLQQSIDALEI